MALIDNIVAYYKFDENTGSTVSDATGNYNGTWQGTLGNQWTTGIINSAGQFNATDNYVQLPNNAALHITGALTISAWVYLTSAKYHCIMDDSLNDATVNDPYRFLVTAGWNLLYHRANSSSFFYVVSTSALSQNTLYHVAITDDGVSTTTFYINGAADTIGSSFNSYLTPTAPNSNPSIGVEAHSTNWLGGAVDEVGIWNRALSSAEISSLYNSGAGLQYPFSVSGGGNGSINTASVMLMNMI